METWNEPSRRGSERTPERGFTTIEIIVGVAVMLILAGVAVPVSSGVVRKAKQNSSRAEMVNLQKALQGYGRDMGIRSGQTQWGPFAPETSGAGNYGTILGLDLEEDVDALGWDRYLKKGWNGPYITGQPETADADGIGATETVRTYQIDAWGRYYVYTNQKSGSTRTVTLTSGGPDRDPTTAADNLSLEVYRGPDW